MLGIHAPAYLIAADPKLYPTYYDTVRNPIFLNDIKHKLDKGTYHYPSQFYSDMKLHFENVRIYNPVGDPYRSLGNKVSC